MAGLSAKELGFSFSHMCQLELVVPKEGERLGKGYVSNKPCSAGLCQGLASFVLVSPTYSKKCSIKSILVALPEILINRSYSEFYDYFVWILC